MNWLSIRLPAVTLFIALFLALGLPASGIELDPLSAAVMERRCELLFKKSAAELAGPRAEFLQMHKTVYDLEVPGTPIRNQCSYGSCWVYATLGELEARILAKTGKSTDLSEYFVVAESLLYRSMAALLEPGSHVGEGGSVVSAEWLMQKFGMVPESVWKPKVNFMEKPYSDRIVAVLNHLISRYHIDSALAETPEARQKLLKQAQTDVSDFIVSFTGPLPGSFVHDGISYASPLEYEQRLRKELDLPVVSFIWPKKSEDLPPSLRSLTVPDASGRVVSTPAVEYDTLAMEVPELEKQIVASLKRGESVPIVFEVAREFMDSQTGIISLSAFHFPKDFKPVPHAYRSAFDLKGGGHLVDIVGARLGEDGRVIAYKIRNSWGAQSGDQGFYHMYADFFAEYLNGAFLRNLVKP